MFFYFSESWEIAEVKKKLSEEMKKKVETEL